jgi:predicted DNA-binding antitoxin AbrB/MazE fold protein
MGAVYTAKADKKIEVVYEGGVFRPLGDVKLKEGTEAFVVIKPGGILEAARRHRRKVDEDLLKEFVEERR